MPALPYLNFSVPAGFPSPAEDYDHGKLDLNELLITHPQATFFFRVSGHSMVNAGIHDRDIVIVNRALRPSHGQIVLAQLDADFTIKYLHLRRGTPELVAANPLYPVIRPSEGQQLLICGVLTSSPA